MKCLLIKDGKGLFSTDDSNFIPLDMITKNDLLKILDLIINNDVEMDPFDDILIKNAAHKIIYRNLYSKFFDLLRNKSRFKDESTSLYRSAIERYEVEMTNEDPTN